MIFMLNCTILNSSVSYCKVSFTSFSFAIKFAKRVDAGLIQVRNDLKCLLQLNVNLQFSINDT